jgi:hypothetical protein
MHFRVLLAATAILIGASAVFVVDASFTKRPLPHSFTKAILALEFARNGTEVTQILGDSDRTAGASAPAATDNPDRRLARYQIAIDAVLIGAYALFFATAGFTLIRRRGLGPLRHVGAVTVATGLLAAYFDVRENEAMRLAVDASSLGPLMPEPAMLARLKWAFFFAAVSCTSPLTWRQSWLGSTTAVAFGAFGIVGLVIDVRLEYPTALGIAVSGFGGAVVLLLIHLLTTRAVPDSPAASAPSGAPAPLAVSAPSAGPLSFLDVLGAEFEYLKRRRFGTEGQRQVKRDLVGLALSGGGIRSATTNLGVLQTLSKLGALQMVDYVCTVSGGGYIGSCLSSLLSLNNSTPPKILKAGDVPMFTTAWDQFPFNPERSRGQEQINHLRTHGSFLMTRKGAFKRETLRSIGQLLSGTVYHLVLALLTVTAAACLYMTILFFGSPEVDLELRRVTEPVRTFATAYEAKETAEQKPGYQAGSFTELGGKRPAAYTIPVAFVYPSLSQRIKAKFHAVKRLWDGIPRAVIDLIVGSTFAFGGVVAFASFWFLKRCRDTQPPVKTKPGESFEDALAVLVLRWAGWASLAAILAWLTALLAFSDRAEEPLWQILPIVALAGVRITSWGLHVVMPRLDGAWNRNMRSLWEAYQATAVYALWIAVLLAVFPLLVYALREHTGFIGLSGVASLIVARALTMRNGLDEKKRPIAASVLRGLLALAIGAGVLLIVVMICAFIVPDVHTDRMWERTGLGTLAAVGLLVGLGVVGDANRLSPHYFYRDRLAEAYLYTEQTRAGTTSLEMMRDTVELKLHRLHGELPGEASLGEPAPTAPLQLISCAINLAGSRDLTRKDRKSGYFVFSKYFCGSRHTGYRPTVRYVGGTLKLARAMTISGAAAGSGMGVGTFFAQAFATVLFNLRLGYWMPNPLKPNSTTDAFLKAWNFWPKWLWREMTLGTDERHSMINLSDGGHTGDNVGIYPLLQRRCKLIIACDAECDPALSFGSFTEAMRHAYIDLGIDIDIDLTMLRPDRETGMSRSHCAVGLIRYPADTNGERMIGYLVYLKNSMTGDEPEPVLNYKSGNSTFPHESTADQFFDDAQFESYRALGVHIAEHTFSQWAKSPELRKWVKQGAPVARATV